ncbi:MAG: CPBP family glutamic-type intramembrane protease [Cypionkella sp.]|jgi:hypothetical protein|nr:CPBP family glutamic-type intramembrane protease [Cypionkella sp.]
MLLSFRQRALRAFILGLPGILLLPFVLRLPPDVAPALVMLNPLLLLGIAALVGALAAPRTGLTSALLCATPLRLRVLPFFAVLGLVCGLAVAVLDHVTAPLWAPAGAAALRENRYVADLAIGLLYGGLTEEVIFRWGLVSILALGLARLMPMSRAVIAAVVLAALTFALSHLPAALFEFGVATWALVARTLILNVILGVIYGMALLRNGLEAAILAHMGTHLGFSLAAL